MIFQTAANVFVYGALLRGMALSHTLTRAKFLGHGRIEGVLYDLGHYPGLQQGAGCVYSELYAVDQNTLDELDCIEGYFPSDPRYFLYERQTVSVRLLDDTSTIHVHSYFYRHNVNSARQIVCGDYRRYLVERSDSLQWYIASGNPGLGHVYIAAPDKVTTEQTPSADYLQHLYLGYQKHGFDVGTLPPL